MAPQQPPRLNTAMTWSESPLATRSITSGGTPCSHSAQAAVKAASMQCALRCFSTPRTERRVSPLFLEVGVEPDHELLDVLGRAQGAEEGAFVGSQSNLCRGRTFESQSISLGLVELRGIEPLTSSLRTRRSPS